MHTTTATKGTTQMIRYKYIGPTLDFVGRFCTFAGEVCTGNRLVTFETLPPGYGSINQNFWVLNDRLQEIEDEPFYFPTESEDASDYQDIVLVYTSVSGEQKLTRKARKAIKEMIEQAIIDAGSVDISDPLFWSKRDQEIRRHLKPMIQNEVTRQIKETKFHSPAECDLYRGYR